MRLTLEKKEIIKILTMLQTSENDYEDYTELIEKIEKQLCKPTPYSKRLATRDATEARKRAVKEKMESAVNLMRLEGEKITAYSVAKKAGISYNSARKYLFLFHND